MISNLAIVCMFFSLIMGFVLPAVAAIYCKKKFGCKFRPFILGCLVFFCFVVVLESMIHSLILNSNIGPAIQNNTLLFAIYGGLMAGIFEETGRLFAYKYLFKKDIEKDYNALMYAAGHGGFECFYLLVPGMISNLIMSFLINTGQTDKLFIGQSSDAAGLIQESIDTLLGIKAGMYLLSPLERISAMGIHFAMSVMVWFAYKNRKYIYFGLALLLHAGVDAITVMLNSKINSLLLEIVLLLLSAGLLFLSYKIFMKEHKKEETYIPGEYGY